MNSILYPFLCGFLYIKIAPSRFVNAIDLDQKKDVGSLETKANYTHTNTLWLCMFALMPGRDAK